LAYTDQLQLAQPDRGAVPGAALLQPSTAPTRPRPEEQAGMIRRYLGWRNRHADDEQLPEIVARAQVA
jgi:hypothetical protein